MRIEGDFPVRIAGLTYTCITEAIDEGVRIRLYFQYEPGLGALGEWVDRYTRRRSLLRYAHGVLDNWVRIIHAREWVYRITVANLLDEKGRDILSVTPETSIAAAGEILADKRIGSVLVLADDGSIAGVLSERDIVRGLAETGPELLQQPASSIMTRQVIVADVSDNMMSVMACMTERRIRHLPVLQDGRPVGVISIGDVIKARLSELEGQSEQLRDYIETRRWHDLYREIGPAAYSADGS